LNIRWIIVSLTKLSVAESYPGRDFHVQTELFVPTGTIRVPVGLCLDRGGSYRKYGKNDHSKGIISRPALRRWQQLAL
jgi:hypothetical protein